MESLSGEWRTVRHDAIAYGVSEFVREAAGFRTKWQPSALPGLPPERKGDVEIFDFPRPGKPYAPIFRGNAGYRPKCRLKGPGGVKTG